MLNGYEAFLININKLYPELYLQIIEHDPDYVKGWINELTDDKVAIEDETAIKAFFKIKFTFHNQWNNKIFVYAPNIPESFYKWRIR